MLGRAAQRVVDPRRRDAHPMSICWVDVSIPMRNGMTAWPGDPEFALRPASRIAQGNSCNTSILTLGTHTGTHIDAPWHFEDSGPRLHEIEPNLFFGDALVVEVADADAVRAEHLGTEPLPPRVLIKTRNSSSPVDAPFDEAYVGVAPDAAERLVAEEVKLVGVDCLSVAPYKQEGQATHHCLLSSGVVVVEGLRLECVSPGLCSFVVLPLPLMDADGAPCRAFVGKGASDA
jgi:arylformamidase